MDTEQKGKPEDVVSRECIFTTMATEAAGLYNLLMSVSTAVLGGTLLFLERIASSPTKQSLWYLGLGWLMLLFCTVACAWVRWKNLESGRLVLENKIQDARKIDKINRWLTKFAIASLALGITLIGVFALINVVHKVNVAEKKALVLENEDKSVRINSDGGVIGNKSQGEKTTGK
jgi:hypothetical protein